jgi:transcriptional regulator with XRE-family HTH domain
MSTDFAKWLAEAMQKAGLNQSEIARRLGQQLGRTVQRSQVNKILLGNRTIRADELLALRNILGEAPLPTKKRPATVPLRGRILSGGHAIMDDAGGAVEAPYDATVRTAALTVEGNSLYPQAEQGWCLFYEDTRSPPAAGSLGKLCVVELDDGRIMVRRIEPGANDGTHDLWAVNAPPIKGVRVLWASPVTWIKPR